MGQNFYGTQAQSLAEFVAMTRCHRRKRPADAVPLLMAEIERRTKLRIIVEGSAKLSRPASLVVALRFAGPLSRTEITWLLHRHPRPDQWDRDDCDLHDADLAIDNLARFGYQTAKGKGLRFNQVGAVIERVVFSLVEGVGDAE